MSVNESEQYMKMSEAASQAAETAYHKIENGTVRGYKAVEDAVVGTYTKIEDAFVGKFLTREGETVAEAKQRVKSPCAPKE